MFEAFLFSRYWKNHWREKIDDNSIIHQINIFISVPVCTIIRTWHDSTVQYSTVQYMRIEWKTSFVKIITACACSYEIPEPQAFHLFCCNRLVTFSELLRPICAYKLDRDLNEPARQRLEYDRTERLIPWILSYIILFNGHFVPSTGLNN